jgi:hypothetical protein
MTPEQMKELADRLDHFALGSGDIGKAADLIRQMAERDALKARRLGSIKITETLGAEFTFTRPLTVKPGAVFDLYAARKGDE